MESLNTALATAFDVDPGRVAVTATALRIDQLEGPAAAADLATCVACFGDGSVSPCIAPPAGRAD